MWYCHGAVSLFVPTDNKWKDNITMDFMTTGCEDGSIMKLVQKHVQ
jgi:hypothetical protein